jgi:selT/selW/selH-like putative selenoprotein
LRNPTEEQNSGQAATSRNVDVPDVNGGNNQPMGALDDMENEFGDDDEFGEFGDKAEDMATPSTHNKKSSLNVDNAQYAAASASISMHRINVMICTAWGYARNFQELRKYLLQKYPAQLDASSITGENYPSPEPAATLAMITQVLQLGAMPLLFFGDSLMGGPNSQPEWYKMILANKMALFFFVYIANAIAQNAAQTGAFEIVHNGKVVFSKLENGQLPNIEEIVNGLRRNGLTM